MIDRTRIMNLLTIKECAKICRQSPKNIRDYVAKGKIPAYKSFPRKILIEYNDLMTFLNSK